MKNNPIYFLLALIFFSYSEVTAQVAKIPFSLKENGHVFLKVKLNNSSDALDFVFDTGATSGVIHKAAAEKIGLKGYRKVRVPGASGVNTYDMVQGQRVYIADNIYLDYDRMISVDLSRFHEISDERYNGIFGYHLLAKYITKIDYERQELVLYNAIEEIDLTGYEGISFDFHNGITIPQFDISFVLQDGKKFSGRVLFDSGAGLTLSVNSPFAKKKKLASKAGKTLASKSESLGSTSTSEQIAIQSIQLGSFKFNDLPILLSGDKKGVSSYKGYLGILGARIIQKFHVILDYQHKKLYLKPNTKFSEPFQFPLSSIRLKKKDNQITVDNLSDSSPAYKAGLRKGDVILSMNQQSHSTLQAYKDMLKEEGKTITVEVLTANNKKQVYSFLLKRLL